MAEIKRERPAIIRFADHEVIVPPNRLRKAVRHAAGDDPDPLTEAQEALDQLSAQFKVWMEDECAQLDKARRLVRTLGFTEATQRELFRAAHDIKGHASTFGYPMAADVADSLCRLIEHCHEIERVPIDFVDQCVEAVCAMMRQSKEAEADEVAATLASEVRTRVDSWLATAAPATAREAGDDAAGTHPPSPSFAPQ